MKMKLTDRGLKALKPKAAPYDVMDTDRSAPRSFGVRVMPTGEISFVLYRRFPGSSSPVRRALGHYGEMTLADARELGRDWIAAIKKGIDPSREEKAREQARIEAERARKANTVEKALEDYFKSKRHLRTIRAVEIELRRELKPWMDKPLPDIGKRDVVDLINGIKGRGANGQARVIYSLVKGFFNWVVENDFEIVASPCAKINTVTLVGQKEERERVLDNHEIRSLWLACDTLGYPLGPYFRLLLLTGVRRNEAADASWPEFDLATKRWVIPAARMKGRPGKTKPHLVPITPAIEALLSELPRHAGGPFLFSTSKGATRGARPIAGFGQAKDALHAAMRADPEGDGHTFEPFTIHDVRRSARTRFSELGIPGDICERLLAHTQPEIERRYNLYGFEKEKRAALIRWHAALEDIIAGRSADKVVPLRA